MKSNIIKVSLALFMGVGIVTIGVIGDQAYTRNTNHDSSWNTLKAERLARSVLLNPTIDDVNKLAKANNSSDAVNILFTQASTDDNQKFQDGIKSVNSQKDELKNNYYSELYTYELIHDPNRAQRKLYYLWENIFSVDAPEKSKEISLDDVKALHSMIYDYTLGNYIQMVEKVRTNYAIANYLDLTKSPKKNPNENFARELMQLFLMGQHTPLDNQSKNYSDADVNALAYILTGYRNSTDHQLVFNTDQHNNQSVEFLGDKYNDPNQVVQYILQKKRSEVSEFLADKLLRFYVTNNPESQDITTVSAWISKNNFDLLPSIKQLLSSDIMYKQLYMNEERYKNPVELVASYYGITYGFQNYNVKPYGYELTDLDFKPYNPGSIFGRDGFNNNSLFLSGTIINRWLADTDKLVHRSDGSYMKDLLNNLLPKDSNNKVDSQEKLITLFEQQLYLGRTLPNNIKESLINYLSTDNSGNKSDFKPYDDIYRKDRVLGLLSLMLDQPEFTMQSGLDAPTVNNSSSNNSNNNDAKLIIVRLRGGIDYQEIVANTNDQAYKDNRKQLALDSTNSDSLGKGYVLNKSAEVLLPLLNSKEAFLINSVGLPNQSRAHDIASEQMETGTDNKNGIITKLFDNSQGSSDLVAVTSHSPTIYRGSQSLDIGASSLTLFKPVSNMTIEAPLAFRFNVLKNVLNLRKYPGNIGLYYSQALLLDKIANEDIANGGSGTPGGKNEQQFPFLQRLMDKGVGKVYYVYGDGGYDTHAGEVNTFNPEIKNLFTNVVDFYNSIKGKYKVSIVIFSEFGRTDKINGGDGTDHGVGGGMIVLSNTLKWQEMTGTITPSQDKNNWTTVQVDERDVWTNLFKDIYNTPLDKLFGRTTTLSSYPSVLN